MPRFLVLCASYLVMAVLLGVSPQTAQARTLVLRGTVGALNDWSLRVELDKQQTGSMQPYSGRFNLRHTGVCTTKDHNLKTGTATADLRGDSLYQLVLKFDDEDCVLGGPVSLTPEAARRTMRCSKSKLVPMTTWSDAP